MLQGQACLVFVYYLHKIYKKPKRRPIKNRAKQSTNFSAASRFELPFNSGTKEVVSILPLVPPQVLAQLAVLAGIGQTHPGLPVGSITWFMRYMIYQLKQFVIYPLPAALNSAATLENIHCFNLLSSNPGRLSTATYPQGHIPGAY